MKCNVYRIVVVNSLSVFPSSFVIKEDNLCVFFALNLFASANAILVCWVDIWVDIDHFSIATISEEQTLIRVGIHLEVRRVIVLDLLTFPRVVAQVSYLWLNLLNLVENLFEVFRLHSIC